MMRTLTTVAAFIAATICHNVASARVAPTASLTRTVRIDDLDLSSRGGRALLDARIHNAAWSLCSEINLAGSGAVWECVRRSLVKSRPQRNAHIARFATRSADTSEHAL